MGPKSTILIIPVTPKPVCFCSDCKRIRFEFNRFIIRKREATERCRSVAIILAVFCSSITAIAATSHDLESAWDSEPGSLKYTVHDLDIPGTAYRSVQMSEDHFGRLVLASGGSIWTFDGDKWSEYLERFLVEKPLSRDLGRRRWSNFCGHQWRLGCF